MEIATNRSKDVLIVAVSGRLDTVTAPEFEKKILELVTPENLKIILNCADLSYISSSGLRVILMTLKKVKANNGKLIICGLQESIKEVFNICGFTSLLTISENCESALSSF
ncbi:MAG: STAS domain-containing protein [Candidatus Marinimicrobia bacterium]|nr:STAS domain-containing protein [Candidatus Neomarinimicrobiota bacterium]